MKKIKKRDVRRFTVNDEWRYAVLSYEEFLTLSAIENVKFEVSDDYGCFTVTKLYGTFMFRGKTNKDTRKILEYVLNCKTELNKKAMLKATKRLLDEFTK